MHVSIYLVNMSISSVDDLFFRALRFATLAGRDLL
jgi:hypothetical protein